MSSTEYIFRQLTPSKCKPFQELLSEWKVNCQMELLFMSSKAFRMPYRRLISSDLRLEVCYCLFDWLKLISDHFKAPKPLLKFENEIIDCTNEKDVNFHKDLLTSQFIGSENCLHLNIFTPKITPNADLPVMIWIHGGGYVSGSGSVE